MAGLRARCQACCGVVFIALPIVKTSFVRGLRRSLHPQMAQIYADEAGNDNETCGRTVKVGCTQTYHPKILGNDRRRYAVEPSPGS